MYPGLVPLIYDFFYDFVSRVLWPFIRLCQNVSGEGLGAFVASWRTCFRVNSIFINPAEWPHLWGQFGMHPKPISEFYGILTILCHRFYDLL